MTGHHLDIDMDSSSRDSIVYAFTEQLRHEYGNVQVRPLEAINITRAVGSSQGWSAIVLEEPDRDMSHAFAAPTDALITAIRLVLADAAPTVEDRTLDTLERIERLLEQPGS